MKETQPENAKYSLGWTLEDLERYSREQESSQEGLPNAEVEGTAEKDAQPSAEAKIPKQATQPETGGFGTEGAVGS